MVPDIYPANQLSYTLSNDQFVKIQQMVYRLAGIDLRTGKEQLVKSRLMKRLKKLGLQDFDQYLAYVEHDSSRQEIVALLDALTTNKTSFFRESQHFDYLREHILPRLTHQNKLRFWSAGCSSGEEPYSLAMMLHAELAERNRQDVKILATDLSTRVLAKAQKAVYRASDLQNLPAGYLQRYFSYQGRTDAVGGQERLYLLQPSVRCIVQLARLNLMDPWPMKGPFDVIFCRNVMIYFDAPTREQLVNRFWDLLALDGHLFIGHSESLVALSTKFRYVQPAIYRKQ